MGKIGNTYVQVLADMIPFSEEVKRKTSKSAMPDAEVKVTADTSGVDKKLKKTRKEADATGDSFSDFGRKVIQANQGLGLLSKGAGLVKWPAIISGANYAAKAVNALGAGTLGLVGSLSAAAGLLGAAPALYGAIGQAAGVVALSGVSDLTSAVGGLNEELDTTSAAYEKLSPQGQKFARTLEELKAPLRDVQKRVQIPLFSGMNEGINEARTNLPAFQKVLVVTSHVMGDLAEKAGRFLGNKGFGKDFEAVGKNNAQLLGRMGDAGLNLADALRHVVVEAMPLVDWLGKSAVHLSELIDQSAKSGRESGALTKFFGETKDLLKVLGPMIADFGVGLWNVIRAGKPLGDDILATLADSADEFRKWTESASGQNAIVKWFRDAKPPLWELGRLIHDVGAAFFDLGNGNGQDGLTSLLKTLRTQILPVIVEVLESSESFGPVFVDFATAALTALKPVMGSNGALTIMLKTVTKLLEAFNLLIDRMPFLGTALTNALTIRAGAGLLGLTAGGGIFGMLGGSKGKSAATGIGTKIGRWLGIGVSSTAASTIAGSAAAGGFSMTTGGGAVVAGGAAGGLLGKLKSIKWGRIGGIGLGIALGTATLDEFSRSMGHGKTLFEELERKAGVYETPGPLNALSRALGSGGDAESKDLLDRLRKITEEKQFATREDARSIRHLIDINDLSDEEEKSSRAILRLGIKRREQIEAANRQQRIFSRMGEDVNLKGRPLQNQTIANLEAMRHGLFTSMAQINRVVDKNSRDIAAKLGKGSADGRRALAANFKLAAKNIEVSMSKSEIGTKKGMARIHDLIQKSKIITATRKQARGFAHEWAKGMKDAKDFTGQHVQDIFKILRRMPPESRKVAAETWLQQLKEASKSNPKLKEEFRSLRAKAVEEFGNLDLSGRDKAKSLTKGALEFLKKLRVKGLDELGTLNKKGSTSTQKFRDNVSGNFMGLTRGALEAQSMLATETNKTLSSLKVKEQVYVPKVPGGKEDAPKKAHGGIVEAQKGAIVPGQGDGDKVPLHLDGRLAAMVEPGELVSVTNRTATAALMGVNKKIKRLAEGGIIEQALGPVDMPPIQYDSGHAGGNRHLHLDFFTEAEAVDIGKKMQSLGWQIGEWSGAYPGFGPITTQHQSPGHYDGTAFDANTAQDETNAQIAQVVKLLGGAGGALGSVAQKLKRIVLDGPEGPLKDEGQATIDRSLKALNKFIQKNAPIDSGVGFPGLSGGSGAVMSQIWNVMRSAGGNKNAGSGVIGNAYAESNLDPTADDGSGNGGLYGFTTSPVSKSDMMSWITSQGSPWWDPGMQTSFMLGHGEPTGKSLIPGMNALGPADAASLFMNEWERPGIPREGVRRSAAARAWHTLKHGGIVPLLKDGGAVGKGKNEKGGLPGLLKRLASPKKKVRKEALGQLMEKIASLGLTDTGAFTRMSDLSTKWATEDEFAGNAASLNKEMPWNLIFDRKAELPWQITDPSKAKFMPATGETEDLLVGAFKSEEEARARLTALQESTLGIFNGQTEANWLGADGDGEIQSLFSLRSTLINAEDQVKNRQKLVADMLKKAINSFEAVKKKILELGREIKDRKAEIEANQRKMDRLKDEIDDNNRKIDAEKNKKSPNKDYIQNLLDQNEHKKGVIKDLADQNDRRRDKIKDLAGHRDLLIPKREDLKEKVIPGLEGQRDGLVDIKGEILGSGGDGFDGLETVQGRVLDYAIPPNSDLSGQIFAVKQRLESIGFPEVTVTDKSPIDTAASTFNVGQLLEFSQALKAGAFKTEAFGSQFAGFFAKGGDIPKGMFGVAGEMGLPEIIEGPAKVYKPGDGPAASGRPTIIQVIVEDEAVDTNKIKVVAGKEFDVRIKKKDRDERSAYLAGVR